MPETRAVIQELRQTRESVDHLAESVKDLANRQRRGRLWTIINSVTIVVVLLLAVFVYVDANNTDDDLRRLGADLFLSSCDTSNQAQQALRADNLSDAETLILITGADETDPERADAYRAAVAEDNAEITDRDCMAELRAVRARNEGD